MIRFRGRKAFDDYAERMVVEHRRDRRSFAISASRKRAWDVAAAEAETVCAMSRRQRIEAWMPVGDLQIPDDHDSGSERGPFEDYTYVGRNRHSPKGKRLRQGKKWT